MSVKTIYFLVLTVFVGTTTAFSQHAYMPLAYDYDMLYASHIYNKNANLHTSVRPLRRSEVLEVYNADSALQSLAFKGKFWQTWVGRKLTAEHFLSVDVPGFELSVDPLIDLRYGREKGSISQYQFQNTRGAYIQGKIGSQVTFMTTFTDNQARYPDYVQNFISNQRVIPGQGLAKEFNGDSWDFRNAFGLVSYTPSKYFNFELGQGRVFFGEGHRSMILSDAAFNYPYFKIETSVWRIKYVNLWAQQLDIRRSLEINQANRKKWLSMHYLSYNVNSRLNISVFETVMYGSDTNNRGIEPSYFNPIIFYRPVESANGTDAANVNLGLGASYKIWNGFMVYGQLTLDELVLREFLQQPGSWRNKYAYQVGFKYLNAFKITNLNLRAEYNVIRPYTFQHIRPLTNMGHFGQPLAHPWGANFNEVVLQLHYHYKRWIVDGQINIGKRGYDKNGENWGSDLYQSYYDRVQDDNNEIAQGDAANLLFIEGRLGYLVNPAYNLRLEIGGQMRNQTGATNTALDYTKGPFVYFGFRTALFNNYFDF